MPVAGRKQVDPGKRRNRMPHVHEWTDVPNVPFKKAPKFHLLPSLNEQTQRWWKAVSTMPHCVLWTKTDWQFAMDTALLHHGVVLGDTPRAAEVRQREKIMGTTHDFRRDLRIRYVDPSDDDEGRPAGSNVRSIDSRRGRAFDAS